MNITNPVDIGLISLDSVTAICIIVQIQLATRHPDNIGPSREVAEKFARQLQERVAAKVPEVAKLMELGWDPDFDC